MAESAEAPTPDEQWLVNEVKQWFMESETEGLILTAYQFADQYCDVFEPDTGEHKLEYTQLHLMFRQLFEEKLNAFLAERAQTPEAFYEAFAKCAKVDEATDGMADMMYCCLQYDFFCQVMCERKRDKALGR
eukprot:gnl/TRDRNA2_/TRDRNA2_190641_c0_seq1.p1 gnl/TRDRNA2_/TRDRNA2_190641_c0~~gnl/TRDRNA2_/TRDRNA2_190641_c0_seq1.p1  ORF type:complete len:143 (+),score=26.23 gnl/TRDRNA2_/TRDRNA2_190641_c0_seq1:36-431(+)